MVDVQAKILAQLSAFETGTKQSRTQATKKDEAQERTRLMQEPDPRYVAAEPYPTLVSQLKRMLENHDIVLAADDKLSIDRHASEMTTLGSALHRLGGPEMMQYTLKTYTPLTSQNYVERLWAEVGAWRS